MQILSQIEEIQNTEKAYRDQLKVLSARKKELMDLLPLGLYSEGSLVAEVKETVRFDPGVAKQQLSPELYKAIQVLKVDAALARDVLTGAEYKACQKVNGRSVTFKKD